MRPTKFPEIPVSLERNTEVFRHPLLWALSPLLIWTGGSTPLLFLEGVPDLPVAPQDEAGLTKTFPVPPGAFKLQLMWEVGDYGIDKGFSGVLLALSVRPFMNSLLILLNGFLAVFLKQKSISNLHYIYIQGGKTSCRVTQIHAQTPAWSLDHSIKDKMIHGKTSFYVAIF